MPTIDVLTRTPHQMTTKEITDMFPKTLNLKLARVEADAFSTIVSLANTTSQLQFTLGADAAEPAVNLRGKQFRITIEEISE